MPEETQHHGPVDWRALLGFDAKAALAFAGCALVLIGLLGILPRWLARQERADFAGATTQTAPGRVTVCQISPVSQGGGGLFNAVNVAFAGRESYYALPPESKWLPKFGQNVIVTYRIGHSGKAQIEAVMPEPQIIPRSGG